MSARGVDYPDYFFQKRIHRIERRPPTTVSIEEAVHLIRSKKTIAHLWWWGTLPEAHEAFLQFAEDYRIPFGETQAVKVVVILEYGELALQVG